MADSPILSYSLLQEISPFSILKHIPSHETDFLPGPHPLFSNSHLLICNCMLNSNSLQEHNRERRTHFLSVTIRNAHKSYLMACKGKGEVVAIWYIPRPPVTTGHTSLRLQEMRFCRETICDHISNYHYQFVEIHSKFCNKINRSAVNTSNIAYAGFVLVLSKH